LCPSVAFELPHRRPVPRKTALISRCYLCVMRCYPGARLFLPIMFDREAELWGREKRKGVSNYSVLKRRQVPVPSVTFCVRPFTFRGPSESSESSYRSGIGEAHSKRPPMATPMPSHIVSKRTFRRGRVDRATNRVVGSTFRSKNIFIEIKL